jgi:hypothetical protein
VDTPPRCPSEESRPSAHFRFPCTGTTVLQFERIGQFEALMKMAILWGLIGIVFFLLAIRDFGWFPRYFGRKNYKPWVSVIEGFISIGIAVAYLVLTHS